MERLKDIVRGEVAVDNMTRIVYSTDASAFAEMPEGVVFPCDEEDVVSVVRWACANGKTLIPRAAGTSIAGQVVGTGVVVDISRHFNRIIEINRDEKWVRVQPGVVRDELNIALKQYGLFFSPETSTSNRCMVGGMVGNNSCGTHSLRYGSVRDHLIEARVVLADGSVTTFSRKNSDEVQAIIARGGLEGSIYQYLETLLRKNETQDEIRDRFPDERLGRRNNGYALDLVREADGSIDLCKILCGSEGTLAFITELKLALDDLPPKHNAVMCVHCKTMEVVFDANLVARRFGATAIELIDDKILELSKKNMAQRENGFFLEGMPAGLLVAEFACDTEEELEDRLNRLEAELSKMPGCYAFPRLRGKDIQRVWALRKAGLGLLGGMEGDSKPAPVVEDTAVVPELLGEYIADFKAMLRELGLECVYYAHIGTGELHLRPVMNLKTEEGRKLFREVAYRTALLVRKYRGSLSGEHGDGRLRGEFIPLMYGETVYKWFCETKRIFDSKGIFNKGKIVNTPPMNDFMRYVFTEPEGPSYFTFQHGRKLKHYVRAIEQCNGAADCRKSQLFGGVMCPAFRATGDETSTTRARANLLRYAMKSGKFDDKDVLEALEECLSCKACKRECPSSVDMTTLKAEYLQHYYDCHGVPLRKWLIGNLPEIQSLFSKVAPWAYNFGAGSGIASLVMGFSGKRKLPLMCSESFRVWFERRGGSSESVRKVCLLVDEFTEFQDVKVGQSFVCMAERAGYQVVLAPVRDSGRTALSKGMVRKARQLAEENVRALHGLIDMKMPLVGLEPSAVLSFRDEYRSLLGEGYDNILDNVMLYDEWYVREVEEGRIDPSVFGKHEGKVLLHGHCHQKALGDQTKTRKMLESVGYECEIIPSGCCGMAGSYGYEHYERSMEIGESVLFKTVRAADDRTVIAAPGTSCRAQIYDGTGRKAKHPIELMV